MNSPYATNTYRCRLLRVVDGDTLQLQVDLGLRCERTLHIRITDINAPELRRGTDEERERGAASKDYAQELFDSVNAFVEHVYVQFSKGKSFDRWLGRVFWEHEDGTVVDFGEEMIKAGHAEPRD